MPTLNFFKECANRYHRVLRAACAGILIALAPLTAFAAPDNLRESAVVRAVRKVSPAVVNISSAYEARARANPFSGFGNPFFDEFFKDFFDPRFEQRQQQTSLGSGVIIDGDRGLILTNAHVIQRSGTITVVLEDRREYEARIVGADPDSDLAVLKIDSREKLPAIAMGDSDDLMIGETVIAIGNPFGFSHTVTTGVVSAVHRSIRADDRVYHDFIQIDASINPGNSGGPLINMKGEVIGINTAIVASGQGIGFAIPINLAKTVIAQLKSGGEVTRGWLGVAIQDVNQEMADYYGIEAKKGVFVADVFKGDPADAAGIKPKDIIVEVNGQKVEASRQLTSLVAEIPVGQTAKVKVLRDGQPKTLNVKIAKRDDKKVVARGEAPEKRGEDPSGLRVSALTPEIAQRFNVTETAGVIVTDVQSGSPAEEAGVRAGDIIKEINRQSIESVRDYTEALKKVEKNGTANLFVWRKNAGFLVLKLKK